MQPFGKLLVLAILAMTAVLAALTPQAAPIRTDLTPQSVLGALGGLFVLVLLIERVTEIIISLWRQAPTDTMKRELECLLKDDPKASAAMEKTKELATYQAETKSRAMLVGFSVSVIACAAGVGLLDTLLDTTHANKQWLRGIDILLTSGLLAGGSDAFHQFTSTLETFFSESKKKMAG